MRRASGPLCLDLTLAPPRKPKTEWYWKNETEKTQEHEPDVLIDGTWTWTDVVMDAAWTVPADLPMDLDADVSVQQVWEDLDRLLDDLMETKEEEEPQRKTCPICWEPVPTTGIMIHVCCGVVMHRDCARRWDEQSHACPWCREGEADPPKPSVAQPIWIEWDQEKDDEDLSTDDDDKDWSPSRPREVAQQVQRTGAPQTRTRARQTSSTEVDWLD